MYFLCGLLVIACIYDYSSRRIPNYLLGIMLLTGLLQGLIENGTFAAGIFAVGRFFLVGGVILLALFPFFRIGALGAGDVKLLAVCAGFFSTDCILYFLFYSMLISAIIIFIRFAIKKDMKERFHYLFQYTTDVICNGGWKLYIQEKEERKKCSICLAGPVLCGVVMHLGGVY